MDDEAAIRKKQWSRAPTLRAWTLDHQPRDRRRKTTGVTGRSDQKQHVAGGVKRVVRNAEERSSAFRFSISMSVPK